MAAPAAPAAAAAPAGAAAALALLLREDPLLLQHGLTSHRGLSAEDSDAPPTGGAPGADGEGEGECSGINQDGAAHAYAAALLQGGVGGSAGSAGWMTSSGEYRQRATEALAEVDRKLALVESLSQRISREAPEAVAGPLLRLHGFELATEEDGEVEAKKNGGGNLATLTATRGKAERLERQSQLLDTVAKRVESTLQRGATRMESATARLSRVLELSATLKMTLRLQFEARKVLHAGSGLDLTVVDLRDLTRAAASVAAMEELLAHPSLTHGEGEGTIDVVEHLRPPAERVASSVRKSAAGLMDELQSHPSSSGTAASLTRLGATLQVYFHLGELPDAAWNAVSSALNAAERAGAGLFHPAALKKMTDSAQSEAKTLAEAEMAKTKDRGADDDGGKGKAKESHRQRKKQYEATYNRLYRRKLREKRAAAAGKWSTAVADAAARAWNLHRVLARRNDPASRRNFLEVVSESPVPTEFAGAEARLVELQNRNASEGSAATTLSKANFSLFALFWGQLSIGLGGRIRRLLNYDNGALGPDVAALFPAVRSAALSMVAELCDAMQMGLSSLDRAGGDGLSSAGGGGGVMGGSAGLEDAAFLGGGARGGVDDDDCVSRADEAAGGLFGATADSWTRVDPLGAAGSDDTPGSRAGAAAASASSTAAVFSSAEWIALRGEETADGTCTGLLALQKAFLEESKTRLRAPLEFLFPEAVAVDENGAAVPVLPALPSRYDLAKLDATIREELSLADPRQGGGDLGMAAMIGAAVVAMLREFCGMAERAIGDTADEKVDVRSGQVSETMSHNLAVAGVMSALASFVSNAGENTFVAPYRPAQSSQHEEAARSCRAALLPALKEIDSLVKATILDPLCRALNRQVALALAKMHRGTYLQESSGDQPSGSFVQIYLSDLFDTIANAYLSRLPNDFAVSVASSVATFSIYAFVSNAALLRPLGEAGRLRLTQDLADFELALEQLVFKGGTSLSLSQIAGGKPYAELRAVRQLLYWTALEDKTLSPAEVARGLLRDAWVKDLRPSTLFHFLFSFAPALLTSPHHFKRMEAGDYVGTLVKLDASVDDGEASAWMTTMACCDAYQQRESVDGAIANGDRRIGAILMVLGPELLRRRRQ
ncbi:hypothetical protein ACHAXT_009209 [Thalassiosira profunda]